MGSTTRTPVRQRGATPGSCCCALTRPGNARRRLLSTVSASFRVPAETEAPDSSRSQRSTAPSAPRSAALRGRSRIATSGCRPSLRACAAAPPLSGWELLPPPLLPGALRFRVVRQGGRARDGWGGGRGRTAVAAAVVVVVGAAAGSIPPVTGWRHTQLRGGGGYPSRGEGNETAAGGSRHTHRTDSAHTHTHTHAHARRDG